jgi:hypothetical protein
MYTRDNDEGWEQSTKFKKAFSMDVQIEFVGVWYTPFFPPADAFVRLMHATGIPFAPSE